MLNILSLGSNCEVAMMINMLSINNVDISKHYYSHIFSYTNIKLNSIIKILENIEILDIEENFKIIYRIFRNDTYVFSFYNINEIINNNYNYDSIHIDFEYLHENNVYFWSHGIVKNKNEFNINEINNYINNVNDKRRYLVQKFKNKIKTNNKTLFILKALKNEYVFEDFIKLNNLLINNDNKYLGIIYEINDNEIFNLNLKNTIILPVDKLTGHDEAIYHERHNTKNKYLELFNRLNLILKR